MRQPALNGEVRPMRIGVMLRAIDEKGGVGVYARNIVRELLAHDPVNRYYLYYRTPENMGTYADRDNVFERLVRAPGKIAWDQVAVPAHCERDAIDVVFHPKFTVPLFSPCPSVMVVHGADWFMPDQAVFYTKPDVLYVRTVMPVYFHRAARVISVSQLTTDNFVDVLGISPETIRTVYFAPARHFRRVEDPDALDAVRRRYDLPDRFVLTLTKIAGDGRKNFGNVVEGYRRYHDSVGDPLPFVVGGLGVDRFRAAYGIPDDGWGADVRFPGWLDQSDLPAIFSLASAYLYASNLEAFPIPLTEAMACGTPIVTSNVNGLVEIADDAAVFVDPRDPDAIGAGLRSVLTDPALAAELTRRGLRRSRAFSWDRCAAHTLAILREAAGRPAERLAS